MLHTSSFRLFLAVLGKRPIDCSLLFLFFFFLLGIMLIAIFFELEFCIISFHQFKLVAVTECNCWLRGMIVYYYCLSLFTAWYVSYIVCLDLTEIFIRCTDHVSFCSVVEREIASNMPKVTRGRKGTRQSSSGNEGVRWTARAPGLGFLPYLEFAL